MNKTCERAARPGADGAVIEPWVALLDFDGTISHQDVTDSLLRRYGRPGWQQIERAWANGLIGSRECMTQQIALLDMTPQAFYEHLCGVTLDPAFSAFLDLARARDMPVNVLSDGIAQAIGFIFERHAIVGVPVYANSIEHLGDSSWQLHTPHDSADCTARSAHCKCRTMALGARRTLYIGDGASDYCAAGKADLVLAKGKLADYCSAQGIAHYPIHDFNDVIIFMARFF